MLSWAEGFDVGATVIDSALAACQPLQVYFQRYLFCKPSIPVDIEFNTLDLMDTLEQYSREAVEQKVH